MNSSFIVKLRKETGAGFALCKEASDKHPDNYEEALKYLRRILRVKADKRSGKETRKGIIEVYSHGEAKTVASIVEVFCETDFVSKSEGFRKLAHEICLQIAGMKPLYTTAEDIPTDKMDDLLTTWREELVEKGIETGGIEAELENMKLKYIKEFCLMDQPYFRDPSKTVKELLDEARGTLGENINIGRFERWEI